ncbi:c-type cytochrome [Abyssogena phaseoliformis symbiont]|uniref:c-type cytochrome n=1 Tax=Abyssogena phaseoliformis symbiont TaxID=596095 RepID=UPI0019159C77|nr:c-type cytochrome [Abyssogena phaseoliformis symbiont]
MKILIILSSALFLSSCFDSGDVQAKEADKVQLGKTTFDKNCLVCHGKAGGGLVKDWKKRQAGWQFSSTTCEWYSAHLASLTRTIITYY